MIVRRADEGDLAAVEAVYEAAIADMRGTPLDILWDLDLHPSRAGLRAAAAAGNLFVGYDDAREGSRRALGAFILDDDQDDDYAQAPWRAGHGAGEALVLHVLVVDPAARGRGTARRLVEAAAEEARQRGGRSLRLDVFDNNEPAARLYLSCGFSDLGAFTLTHNGEFTHVSRLMELVLTDA